jgi:isopentenyl diphosphate isomerase/L-lactate dehydrogenase-like FMN-dependent dehydrogenase
MASDSLFTVEDYEKHCREIMPRPLFDVLFGTYGSPYFRSNTNNLDGFSKLRLRPRILAGVEERNLATTVLGQRIELPVMIAPVGGLQRAHPDGELAAARAAASMGTLLTLSTGSNYSLEEVAQAATGPLWFQLYFFKDRGLNEILIRRAEDAGYKAIVLTVDNVTEKTWEREYRADPRLSGPPSAILRRPPRGEGSIHNETTAMTYRSFVGMDLPVVPNSQNLSEMHEKNLQWSDVEWLREHTRLPIVVKGVQTAEDALLCVEHGVDALVVSNHGGHTVDNLYGTIETLPEVAEAVDGRLEIYLDGGIRRGTDVMKALALGARAVQIGRATFWGLKLGGEAGLRSVLEIIKSELFIEMGRCGMKDVDTIDRSLVQYQGITSASTNRG